MIISIVVAISENNAIGKENKLLWHLPADLQHFKTITSGHPVIMGRKTFDSIGKPLPNRRNILVTRNTALAIPGVEIVHSLDTAIACCQESAEVFIIGGAEIFKMAMNMVHKIYLTIVEGTFEADTFFPDIDPQIWKETERISYQPDEKNRLGYTFLTLIRK